MKLFALRFGDNFAPKNGTIDEHKKYIEKYGFVWYGKFGNPIGKESINDWMNQDEHRILLIKSATMERYWAYVDEYSRTVPTKKYIPSYYRDKTDDIKCWFKITRIEEAPKNVVSKCYLVSTRGPLGTASKVSMNPCMYCYYEE